MYATRLQRLCSQYSSPSPGDRKVSATRQPPAVNAGPSGLYDNYQRRKDQELMEEAIFMNTGLLPKTVARLSSVHTQNDQALASVGMSRKGGDVLSRTTKISSFVQSQIDSSSQTLARSLPPESQSLLRSSTRSPVQLPHKELDKLASSRAEELEIDSIKAGQLYSAKVTKTALSHRSRLDTLL